MNLNFYSWFLTEVNFLGTSFQNVLVKFHSKRMGKICGWNSNYKWIPNIFFRKGNLNKEKSLQKMTIIITLMKKPKIFSFNFFFLVHEQFLKAVGDLSLAES